MRSSVFVVILPYVCELNLYESTCAHVCVSRNALFKSLYYGPSFQDCFVLISEFLLIGADNFFKVSQNTGLARDLSFEEQQLTIGPAQKPPARVEGRSDCVITSRYYFPSAQNKLLHHEKNIEDGSSSRKRTVDAQFDESNTAVNDDCSNSSKVSVAVSSSHSAVTSCYPVSEDSLSDSNSAPTTPIDLSNKPVGKLIWLSLVTLFSNIIF